MKANEAPEKIFLEWYRIGDEKYREWCIIPKTNDEPVEYTSTDVFIDKACDAYYKVCGHYPHTVPTHICRQNCDYYDNFKQSLKGETKNI